jgi:hypothetical protein
MEDFLSEGKVEGKVYDKRTLMAIFKLMKRERECCSCS